MNKAAEIIRNRELEGTNLDHECAKAMAELFMRIQDNPRFSRDRFLEACGLNQQRNQ